MTDPARYGNPVLPGSDPSILRGRGTAQGILIVIPVDALETHALVFDSATGRTCLATHPNGYSCHELATRILDAWRLKTAEAQSRALAQARYIADCGGLVRSESAIRWVVEGCNHG